MKKNHLLGSVLLALTLLQFPIEFSKMAYAVGQSPTMISVNIPNFEPSANYRNGVLNINIPATLLQGALSEALRANEGRIKDTEFQRLELKNMRTTLRNGGIRINGNWHFEARERTFCNPLNGSCSHTPWAGLDGHFHQDFNISVNNGRLLAETSGRPHVSSSRWYGIIVEEVVHHMGARGDIKRDLDQELANFNGLDLQGLLINYGANAVASQFGVNPGTIRNFINSHVGDINASVQSSGLTISLGLPRMRYAESPVLEANYYLENNPDVARACNGNLDCARGHFIEHGLREGRIGSSAFHPKWYLDNHPDLKNAFGDDYVKAAEHWLDAGLRECRSASPELDVWWYLHHHSDLLTAFGEDCFKAADHWVKYGRNEGRQGTP